MFGFARKDRKSVEVHRVLGRIANRTFSPPDYLAESSDLDQRQESRHRRLLPVLYSPLAKTEEELIDRLQPGLTQDLSHEGFALLSMGELPRRPILVALGFQADLSLLLCECRYTRCLGYDYWVSGMHSREVVPGSSYPLLVEAVRALQEREQNRL